MRALIGSKLVPELTPEQEKAINPYRKEDRVTGAVMTEPAATAAYISETRQFYAILAGIVLVLTVALGLLAEPGDLILIYSVIVATNLLLWLFLYLLLSRRIATWKAAVGGRGLGLAPAGTTITVDEKGLDVGGMLHAWPSLRIDQVDLTDLTAERTPLFLIERLSLATSSEVVVLDSMLIGNGRLIVGNAWRRLRAPNSGFDNSWRWIAWLILSIGGLIVAGGILIGQGSLRLVLQGAQAEGEVIELRRDGQMYEPVIHFRLPNGRRHEVKDLGSGAPDFAVGDRVTVLYWPDDPDSFRLDTFERLWLNAIIVTCFGCFWLLFGLVAWGLSRGVDLAVLGEGMFATIAAGAVLVGIATTWTAAQLYSGGLRTEGEVLEIRASRHTEREEIERGGVKVKRDVERVSFVPVVRFTTNEGRAIEFHGRGGSETAYSKGDLVPVIYDPARPINAQIVSFLDFWLPAVVAWTVAIVFGGAVRLSRWSRLRARPLRSSP